MISIASYLYSTLDPIILDEVLDQTSIHAMSRRVSRTATLDGSAVIQDNGFTDADRTFRVYFSSDKTTEIDSLKYLIRYHSKVTISTEDGFYLGVIESIDVSKDAASISILIEQRLD